MSKMIFWITDGVNSNDEYRVITKADEKIKYCVHCSNKNKDGFTAIGDKINYTICNNCLYKPSTGMINNNFISISKTKDEKRFNEILELCENKAEYLKVIQSIVSINSNDVIEIRNEKYLIHSKNNEFYLYDQDGISFNLSAEKFKEFQNTKAIKKLDNGDIIIFQNTKYLIHFETMKLYLKKIA